MLALFALRVGVGWQFYREGVDKIHDPQWTSAGFLRAAKGPLAPLFHSLVPDPDGLARLDEEATLQNWAAYRQRVFNHYGFGDQDLLARLRGELNVMRVDYKIAATDKERDRLQRDLNELRGGKLARLESQQSEVEAVYQSYEKQLKWFFAVNGPEIDKYRLGLVRRADQRQDAARMRVASLRGQADKLDGDLRAQARPWLAQLDDMWAGYERDLNMLAIPEQRQRGWLKLEGPATPASGFNVAFLNRYIPWFDMALGGFLLLGLFTRPAALAGAAFLLSVVATQWPLDPDAAPTYYQFNLMLALLVVAVFGAGKYAGLDFFVSAFFRWCFGRSPPAAAHARPPAAARPR